MSRFYKDIVHYNVSIINDPLAITYPHPTINSKYLWSHSFRFMFQFRHINVICLFSDIVYLPIGRLFLINYRYVFMLSIHCLSHMIV